MTGSTLRRDAFLSVIVPVHEAVLTIEPLLRQLSAWTRSTFEHYEIVVVDDASRDGTVARVRALQSELESIQLYCLHRPLGFEVALVAGLDNAIGDWVITFDYRLHSVEDLPALIAAAPGHEMVFGLPAAPRPDFVQQRFAGLFQKLTGLLLPRAISHLRLYTRGVVNYILQNNDRDELLYVLPVFATQKIAYVTCPGAQSPPRFGWAKAARILLSCSITPLRLLTLLALLASGLSFLYAAYIVGVALLRRQVVEGWISLALPIAIMFMLVSTILGVLSEYVYRIVLETKKRPVYFISAEHSSSVAGVQNRLNVVGQDGALKHSS